MAEKIDISSITKFDGKNYRQWKFQVTCALKAKGLNSIVNGNTVRPEETKMAEVEKWDKYDAIAMFTLTSAMDLTQITLIENCNSSKEILDKMDSIYEQKSETNKMLVHERYHQYKMDPKDSISQHIAKVENLAKQIKDTGEELSNVAIMTKILGSLPMKYRNLRQAWLSMDEAKQTIPNLTARLLDEEASLSSFEETERALLVSNITSSNFSSSSTNKKGKSNKNVTCYNCQKKGHFANKCRAPKKSKEDKKSNNTEKNSQSNSQSNFSAFISEEVKMMINSDKEFWILDSGASAHMTYRRDYFSQLEECLNFEMVKLGNNQELTVKGKGTVQIKKFISGQWYDSCITNVLFVPELRKNLFSEGVLTGKGMKIVKISDSAEIYDDKQIVATAVRESNNLYRLLFHTKISIEANAAGIDDIRIWHERLGHINNKAIRELVASETISKLDLSSVDKLFCEGCMYGKQHKLPFKSKVHRKTQPGEFIHSDVCGPMSIPSVQGAKYFILFKDDCSGYRVVYFIKHKSDALTCFKEFASLVKNKFGKSIMILHIDNGKEYCNKEFNDYLVKHGITLETTAPYTPEQNGKAERDLRTIVECARSMLYTKDIPTYLWAEAVNTAVYILNRTPNSHIPSSSPYEIWTGKKPILNHIKTFGCDAYMHVPKELRNKLAPKSKKFIFVGYDGNSTNYRLYEPETKKIKISRNVTFNENSTFTLPRKNTCQIEFSINDDDYDEDTSMNRQNQPEVNENSDLDNVIVPEVPVEKLPVEQVQFNAPDENIRNLRNRDNIKPPSRYILNLVEIDVPESYEDAMNSNEAAEWTKSMKEELEALMKNNTWDVVTLPPGKHTVGSKWVFRVKRHPNGDIERFKSRLCAKGFVQKEGVDYNETFAPTTRFDSVRVLLSTAARHDFEIMQFDVQTAFLYGDLVEEIYLKPPNGTNIQADKVCKLNKSLYGLKQAPHCWNKKFNSFLNKFGLTQSNADKCVYHGIFNGNAKVYLALYVDDGLVFAETKQAMDVVITHLKNNFDVKVSEPNYFVGMQIERNRIERSIFIHQTSYIQSVIKRFNHVNAKPVTVPADPHTKLNESNNPDETEEHDVPYRELVGSLIFAATVSRPDIAFAVGVVSRYLDKHTNIHWNAVKNFKISDWYI